MTFKLTLLYFSCQQNEFEEQAIKKVDDLLESYMGIRDLDLGRIDHYHWEVEGLGSGLFVKHCLNIRKVIFLA